MTTNTIERDLLIKAPIDRVWSLVTEAEHLGTWFGDQGADIDLRPGGALEVRWDGHLLTGVVDSVEPTSRFAFRWRQIDDVPDAELGEGNSTLVEFLLDDEGGATRLRVVESGFASLALPEADRDDMHASHTEGWQRETAELDAHAVGAAV